MNRADPSRVARLTYDRDFVTSLVLASQDNIVSFVVEIGTGEFLAMSRAKGSWPTPGEGQWVLAMPDQDERLTIDRTTGAWAWGGRRGDDLLSLAVLRWGCTPAKAAWRIARLCNRARPKP